MEHTNKEHTMKQSEIQAIINEYPDAVFTLNTKYSSHINFIIIGFTKQTKNNRGYGATTTYAITKSVGADVVHGVARVSEHEGAESLRNIVATQHLTTETFAIAKKVANARKNEAAVALKNAQERMDELKPYMRKAFDDLGIKNSAYNFGTTTTYKVELDQENAMLLLATMNFLIDARK